MVKIDNVISMDFVKTPILVLLSKSSMYGLDNSAFQIHFVFNSNFCTMIKIREDSPRKVITSINLVLAKFRH